MKTLRRNIVINAYKLDSLEMELERRDRYFESINTIIRGGNPLSYENARDTSVSYEEITFDKSEHDSLLRQQIEEESELIYLYFTEEKIGTRFRKYTLLSPS